MSELEGCILKLDSIDKCGRKFAADCKITFLEKIPVTLGFDRESIIGYAELSESKDGIECKVVPFDSEALPENEYFVGGYYTHVKSHKEGDITVIDSGRMVSMSIIPEHSVADNKLKIRRHKND